MEWFYDFNADFNRNSLTEERHLIYYFDLAYRSSHQRCSIKKGVLRNFPKFTGKHLCQSLFVNKVTLAQAFFLKILQNF